MEWAQTEAEVVSGQQLASGTSKQDAVFAQEIIREDGARGKGTIFLQAYAFRKIGFDLDAYFGDQGYVKGTLNLLIAPMQWTLNRQGFQYFLEGVRWTDRLDKKGEPPFVENFFIDPCQVGFEGKLYKGLVYIPDPETKPKQYRQSAPYIDVIAPHIPNIAYGSTVMFYYNPRAIMTLAS